MIVKILNSSGSFNGVDYNDKKVDNGKGELVKMKNFPSYIDNKSSANDVKNYFKFQASSSKIKNAQFHLTISTKGRTHSKEDLSTIAEKFMDKMDYGKQPYIVVFHKDTQNNHVHIVSSRVSNDTGLKINDSFEGYKFQAAIQEVMKELYGVDNNKKLDTLLNYSYSNQNQFKKLLEENGFKVRENEEEKTINITCDSLPVKSINIDEVKYNTEKDKQRIKQIYAILNKYKSSYSNQVFKVVDPVTKNISFQSELQRNLKLKFGLDLQFSFKDEKQPFGYTIIDNKTNTVLKGSEVMKMNNLFEFTADKIDKPIFDLLTNTNLTNNEFKDALKVFLNSEYQSEVKDYMLSKNNIKVPYSIYDLTKQQTIDLIRNFEKDSTNHISIFEHDHKHYVFNKNENKIFELKVLVGEANYNLYLQKEISPISDGLSLNNNQTHISTGNNKMEDLLNFSSVSELLKTSASNEEEEQNRKRKKRTR